MSDSATSHDEGRVGVSAAPDPDPDPVLDSAAAAEPTPVLDSAPTPEATQLPEQVFGLRSPPPVRALAIASGAAIVGAVVIVLSGRPAVTVVGAVLLGFGVLLAVLAIVLAARLRSRICIGDAGLEVSRGGRRGFLAWVDIDRVQESRHQLIAVARGDHRDLVITVPGPRGGTYVRLVHALKLRLDASRGYGS